MNLTAIFIVGIIAWALVSLFGGSEGGRRNKKRWDDADKKIADLEHELEKMTDRIKVIEKIVTDEKYELNRQFDELNK